MASKRNEPDRPGRKSGIRRFVYRPSSVRQQDQRGSAGSDWGAIKDQLRRTVEYAPEVVIKVEGGGTTTEGVLRYMTYISRKGELQAVDEKGERVVGQDGVNTVHSSWDLDLQRPALTHRASWSARSRARQPGEVHQSFNLIFSMPAKTDPLKLFAAVQRFAGEHLGRHQYMMALHTPETDPQPNPPPHPHVHVVVRAEDEDGQRLYIRKDTLRAWRESFAAHLRAHGVEANATSRAVRGVSRKPLRSAEYQIQKRIEKEQREGKTPTTRALAMEKRFAEAAQELQEGSTGPRPWEAAMAARRRDVLRELVANAARLRSEGDVELATKVEHFAANLPPLDTERHQMQRQLAAQVENRLQELQHGKDESERE